MINIALISDIHFGKLSRTIEFAVPGEEIRDENKGAVSINNSLIKVLVDNKVQYLFIAGDLTSTGSPHEFFYCQNKIIDIADKAGIPKNNIIIGLGNHDIDWRISNLYDCYNSLSGTAFPLDLVKEKYQKIAAQASIQNMPELSPPSTNGPAPYSGIIENNDFITIILNSGWLCTKDQEFPHGKLSQNQLEWFERCAVTYRQDKRWKMVLLHHHPFSYPFPTLSPDISVLEEGSHIIDIAGNNGINIIMHGHRHHPKAKTIFHSGWHSPVTFICAGSLSVNSQHRNNGEIPNTLHIISLSDNPGNFMLLNYQYTPTDGYIPLMNNCTPTPLESIMYLGKVFEDSEINDALSKLESEVILEWDDLAEPLRYIECLKLNNMLNDYYPDKVVGKFPGKVLIKNEV